MRAVDIPEVRSFPLSLHLAYNDGEVLGTGYFSYVKQHPKRKNEVIKLATNDRAYCLYLRIVLANQNNPFFPKVYEAYKLEGENTVMVRMEKLDSMRREMWLSDTNPKKKLLRNIQNQLRYSFCPTVKPYTSRFHMQAVAAINNMCDEHNIGVDLHGGNVMFRGRQIVITDPVA